MCETGQRIGQACLAIRLLTAQIGDQRIKCVAAGGGKTRRLGLRVDFLTGAGKGKVQRLLLAKQLRPGGLQFGNSGGQHPGLPARGIAFRQQRGDLRLEVGNPDRGGDKVFASRLKLPRQRGDQCRLGLALGLRC